MRNKAKSVTIFDVADLAGVSKSTVSLVLTQSKKVSDKSKQQVLKAIDELGYVYNRDAAAMRSKRSNLIAIVINDLTNPVMAQLATELEQILNGEGFQAVIVSSNNNVEQQTRAINKLKEYNAAGFIICPVPNTCTQWLDTLHTQHSVVTLMQELAFSNAPCVLPDYKKASHIVSMHLLSQGVTNIAFIGSNLQLSSCLTLQNGFNTACAQHSILPLNAIECDENTAHSAKNAFTQAYKNNPAINAIVCANDIIAHGVLAAIKTLPLTAEQRIKVVSCQQIKNNTLLDDTLTSVAISTHDIAKRCLLVLQELLQNTAPPVKTLVNVNLQIKESSQ
jgi:LacI family transcriptional regulator